MHTDTHVDMAETACCASCDNVFASADGPEDKKFTAQQKKEIAILVFCFVSLALTLIFEDSIFELGGIWLVRFIYAIPYAFCSIPVFKQAFSEFKKGKYLNEFTLMAVATIAAICLNHLSEAVGVMLFYSIGEFLQDLATAKSRGSIKALLASRPTTANLLLNGEVEEVAVENIKPGNLIVVRPGEKIPLDGIVMTGASQVDQSPLTGESVPVYIQKGQEVNAGCINLDGVLEVQVTTLFEDSHMARILDMVENAAARKSPTERFITRFARYYTPVVFALAILVAIIPPLAYNAPWELWIYRSLVLLIVSCPCALLISIPLGYFGGIGAASRSGILVKGGNVFDALLKTSTIVFDKTGTLSAGKFLITELIPAKGVSQEELLAAAAYAECESNHPIARAVMQYVGQHITNFKRPENLQVEEVSGEGMRVRVGADNYSAGRSSLIKDASFILPQISAVGSVVYVAKNNQYLGYILVADSLKPEAKEAVQKLKALGLKTVILSGDREKTVAAVAKELDIDFYRSELFPGGKVDALSEFDSIKNITFVGDGINDAPSLAIAKVGIAMGKIGAEAAVEAADAVIINDSPSKIVELFRIARKVRAVVWQNIVLALGVKGVIMFFGVVGISGLWEAVFADVGVALLALLNSVRTMKS